MRKDYSFYPLLTNYNKVEENFGHDYLIKSFYDELTPEEVIIANEKLAKIIYGEELYEYIKNHKINQIRNKKDNLMDRYDKNLSTRLSLDDYGLLLVRAETMGIVEKYREFINSIGLSIIYEKDIKVDIDQYLMLYSEGIMLGLSMEDDLFDFPTRTLNFINNTCHLMIVKSKIKLNQPVSEYLHSFKGKHGNYTKDTLRGDVVYNSLLPYTIDGVTLQRNANVPLDPIGAYRALVRGKVPSDGWHNNVSMPILFYSGQGVHIPNMEEIEKDLGVLCSNDDIKVLIKK